MICDANLGCQRLLLCLDRNYLGTVLPWQSPQHEEDQANVVANCAQATAVIAPGLRASSKWQRSVKSRVSGKRISLSLTLGTLTLSSARPTVITGDARAK